MKKLLTAGHLFVSVLFATAFLSCNSSSKKHIPSGEAITAIQLKTGEIVSCGPPGKEFGAVAFNSSCDEKYRKDFDLAIALLHSFEYDEAEKAFAKVIAQDPACAMAYWGVAMSNYHEVWPSPPSTAELEKGSKAIAIARSIPGLSSQETAYIEAMAVFYDHWDKTDHRTRARNFSKAMEGMYKKYPSDKEVAAFYALSLNGAADPADKTYANQRKAGDILNALYLKDSMHPGIVHYLIHSYDYPPLAVLALPAARRYASIAPSSAHAQHMPSHIFTRLGLWDECIQSNLVSTASAKCYAESAGIKGHWDEELHGMDYLVYAYLQKGENNLAKAQLDYLRTIREVYPVNFKDAYAFAAIPARYFLENKMWQDAASMEMLPAGFPWKNFPWQSSIIHFARLLGAAHTGNLSLAKLEAGKLHQAYDTLTALKDTYKATQVMVQLTTGEAWILFAERKTTQALQRMKQAAEIEDKTEKSPVTPGEIIPARELLGDMLLQLDQPAEALQAYSASLITHPNRFNGLYGAALASEKTNATRNAIGYYRQLTSIANPPGASRAELAAARLFLQKQKMN